MSFFSGLGGAILSGAANIFGGSQANEANAAQAAKAAKFNAMEAERNRRFQKNMSDSSYQRAVKDLKAAGLNPMLAYSQGGASTPSGSSASATPAKMENVVGPAVASAMEAKRLSKELQQADAGIALTNAQKEQSAAQTKLNAASAKVAEKNAKALDLQMPAIGAQSKYEKEKADMDSNYVLFDSISNRANTVSGTINNATSAFKPFNKIGRGDIMDQFYKKGPKPRRGDTLINRKGEIRREF